MYADTVTDSMKQAIDETDRRRAKQVAYNEEQRHRPAAAAQEDRRHPRPGLPRGGRQRDRGDRRIGPQRVARPPCAGGAWPRGQRRDFEGRDTPNMPRAELADLIKDLTAQMMAAARDLQFELAARIRDEIADLKKELRGMDAAGLR